MAYLTACIIFSILLISCQKRIEKIAKKDKKNKKRNDEPAARPAEQEPLNLVNEQNSMQPIAAQRNSNPDADNQLSQNRTDASRVQPTAAQRNSNPDAVAKNPNGTNTEKRTQITCYLKLVSFVLLWIALFVIVLTIKLLGNVGPTQTVNEIIERYAKEHGNHM